MYKEEDLIHFTIDTKIFSSRQNCVKYLENSGNGLTVMHLNICSINKHFEELLILIHELNNYPDVIVCSEKRQVDIKILLGTQHITTKVTLTRMME